MAFAVVLDTCVLYPANLTDSLLRVAEAQLYVPQWSNGILAEFSRNLLERGIKEGSVGRLLAAMATAFPEADVTGYEQLIGSMTCHEKDRHVLAAVVRAKASSLVTFNVKDFPQKASTISTSKSSTPTTSCSTCSTLPLESLSEPCECR